ncbi:hypothetical protein KKD70_02570 [Patescibacteria group bacterium]|nr:hypothetical protein [Patescibacteria group bacterium]
MRNLRAFFLAGSIVLAIVILVVAFQNIQAQCNFVTFFFLSVSTNTSPTLMIFGVSIIGIITGMFLMGLIMSFLSNDGSDEEDEF